MEGANKVGNAVTSFALTGLDGETYKPEDFKGKVLVLFFISHNCPVCIGAAPSVEEDVWQVYKDQDFQILGLDMWNGSRTQLNAFKTTTGVTFPLLLTAGGFSFGISTSPMVDAAMVVDQEGVIAHIRGFTVFTRGARSTRSRNCWPRRHPRSGPTSSRFSSRR